MLDYDTRSAILRLRREGHGHLTIARALKVSRNAVRRVEPRRDIRWPCEHAPRWGVHTGLMGFCARNLMGSARRGDGLRGA